MVEIFNLARVFKSTCRGRETDAMLGQICRRFCLIPFIFHAIRHYRIPVVIVKSAAAEDRFRPKPRRTKGRPMKKGTSKRLTRGQLGELKALAVLPDRAIDTSDAPEVLDWSSAKRGLFYRPVNQQLTLRLDADVVAWFKRHTTSNEVLKHVSNRALSEYVQGQASGRSSRHADIIAASAPPAAADNPSGRSTACRAPEY
jgi:uncharacterized protein (DUF4415 family)